LPDPTHRWLALKAISVGNARHAPQRKEATEDEDDDEHENEQ
jgi:hypothetical protein